MQKIIVLLVLALSFSSCENDMEAIKRVIEQEETAIERAIEVEMLYSDSAVVKVRIKAPVMDNYLDRDNPRREFPQGLNVDVFNERKKIVSKLSAKYALQNEKDSQIFLRDSVVVVTLQNERLETEELIWDEKRERVHTDKFVKMSTPTETIYGLGFHSNLDFTKWTVLNPTGEIEAPDLMEGVED